MVPSIVWLTVFCLVDKSLSILFHDRKLDALEDIIESANGNPIILFCGSIVILRCCRSLGGEAHDCNFG